MDKNSTSLTLYQSKFRNFCLLIASFIFILGARSMMSSGEFSDRYGKIIIWSAFILFGLGVIYYIIALFVRSSYLHLSEKGFRERLLFGDHFTEWKAVAKFKPIIHQYVSKRVGAELNPEYKNDFQEEIKRITRVDADYLFHDNYGKSVEKLIELLNEWKERFSKE